MNKKIYFIFVISAVSIMLLSGCATASGEAYSAVENTNPEQESLLYVYRPAEGFWTKANGYPTLYVNDEVVGPLKIGGYLVVQVPIGEAKLVLKNTAMNFVTGSMMPRIDRLIEVEKSQDIYIKVVGSRSVLGNTTTMSIQEIQEKLGIEEIKLLKLSK